MKKERTITIFYLVYFAWLFSITYLIVDPIAIDIYAVIGVSAYFIFLRERYDAILFSVIAIIPIILEWSAPQFIPLWIPLSWGTTAIALKKFFVLVQS